MFLKGYCENFIGITLVVTCTQEGNLKSDGLGHSISVFPSSQNIFYDLKGPKVKYNLH